MSEEVKRARGIEVTDQNKREIDKVIHSMVNVEYKNCPATWREVKKRLTEDQDAFVQNLGHPSNNFVS